MNRHPISCLLLASLSLLGLLFSGCTRDLEAENARLRAAVSTATESLGKKDAELAQAKQEAQREVEALKNRIKELTEADRIEYAQLTANPSLKDTREKARQFISTHPTSELIPKVKKLLEDTEAEILHRDWLEKEAERRLVAAEKERMAQAARDKPVPAPPLLQLLKFPEKHAGRTYRFDDIEILSVDRIGDNQLYSVTVGTEGGGFSRGVISSEELIFVTAPAIAEFITNTIASLGRFKMRCELIATVDRVSIGHYSGWCATIRMVKLPSILGGAGFGEKIFQDK